VEISSSYFPYYLRNLNTGADNIGLETRSVVARQTIHHDRDAPSHVVLPVIPSGGNFARETASPGRIVPNR
jgi:predicted acyl esterase